MNSPFFMSEEVTIERQRPQNPNNVLIKWSPEDRFYKSLVIDYVSGMSQRAYLFEEANQSVYKPMLGWAMNEADLYAPTNLAGVYGLQIDFVELDTQSFGMDLAGKSVANYRIVSRQTGQVIYEKQIASNFVAIYPRLNEDDASQAYDISSKPFFSSTASFLGGAVGEGLIVEAINNNRILNDFFGGNIDEASQGSWNDFYQSYIWVSGISLVAGPTITLIEQINPMNYLSLKFNDRVSARSAAQARRGPLSVSGLGSRNGAERARQVNAQILAQSISYFLADLSDSEGVGFTQILPCGGGEAVSEMWTTAMHKGLRVISDSCGPYMKTDSSDGFGLSTWK